MNMKEYAFGIDLGGTTAKVGLFTTAGALLEKWEVPTDTSNAGEYILGNLAKAVKDKMQENGITAEQVEGVGVGVPGPVLDSRIVPIICANLGGWGKHNVAEELGDMLGGIKVLVGNDAAVQHRAGHAHAHALYLLSGKAFFLHFALHGSGQIFQNVLTGVGGVGGNFPLFQQFAGGLEQADLGGGAAQIDAECVFFHVSFTPF